jgi:hypothetical protein
MRCAAMLVLLVAGSARAEDERAVSVGLGWATFSTVGKKVGNMDPPQVTPDVGGAVAVTYEHAIGTELMLRGELAGGAFYGGADKPQSKTSYAALADAGAVFRFDVLKYVPYAFVGLGGVATTGGPIDRGVNPVLAVGGGLDILQSRSLSYGFELRLASFGGDVTVVTLGARISHRWGYF